jgi:hypothetical protein
VPPVLDTMGPLLSLLQSLNERQVDFVLVGGMAATAHGSTLVTQDLDVCVRFDLATLTKILEVLRGKHPRQRMHRDRPELSNNPKDYEGWHNLYVVTDDAQVDFLSEVTGVGQFEDVKRESVVLDLGGFNCSVLGIDALIRAKRKLGRPKDLRTVSELEAIARRTERP